jgi:Pacifastin inhibitor (LCMII).
VCTAGAVFNRGCNTCWCSRDGMKLDCTHMECTAEGSEEEAGG